MRILIAAFMLCLGIGSAEAGISLILTVNGTNVTQPDQIVASLTAQTQAASAAAAQGALNRLVVRALAATGELSGVKIITGGYNVNEIDPQTNGARVQFQASQALTLTMAAPDGVPPANFTKLIGDLQSQGLLLESIGGALSQAGQDAARAAAMMDAIHRLRTQSTTVAQALGDQVAGITSLTINANDISPMMPRGMMAMAAAAPPQVVPGPITISVTIDATIDLKPPGG